MHEHGHALALDDPAQGAADGLDHAVGLDGDRAADDLLGQEQGQLDGVDLELVGGRDALLVGRRDRGLQGLQRRAERGERLGAAGLVALRLRGGADHLGLGLGAREQADDRVQLVPSSKLAAGSGASSASKENSVAITPPTSARRRRRRRAR
jgi:hypothetical protein